MSGDACADVQVYELSGGPGCGWRLMRALGSYGVCLIEFPCHSDPSVREVWAYQKTDRTAPGTPFPVLDSPIFTGLRGISADGQMERKKD